jgi:hypothetical protein
MKGELKLKKKFFVFKINNKNIFFAGYQTRWCRVDAENGILSYYLNETDEQLVPRGKVQLIGALGKKCYWIFFLNKIILYLQLIPRMRIREPLQSTHRRVIKSNLKLPMPNRDSLGLMA